MVSHIGVVNLYFDSTIIVNRRTGKSLKLNSDAEKLISDTVTKGKTVWRKQYQSFFNKCVKFGILSANGKPQINLRRINQKYHLKRMQIEVTTRCNLSCDYCYSESNPKNSKRLDIEKVLSALEDFAELGGIYIDFTGGEFFTYKNWRTCIERASELGLLITVHTNGTVARKEDLRFLKKHQVFQVQFSLDSHIDELHDSIRGQKGSLKRTITCIRNALDLSLKIRLALMVHKENKEHVVASANWLADNFNASILLDRIMPYGGERTANRGLTPQEFYEAVYPALNRDVSINDSCPTKQEIPADKNIEPFCGVGNSLVYITSEGEIANCPTMTSRDDKNFSGPNLNETSLFWAWNNADSILKYRGVQCRNINICPASEICTGGCRSNAYADYGSLTAPDSVSCNMHKNHSPKFKRFDYFSDSEISVVNLN